MDGEEFISIPHFINPHLFWFHQTDGQNPSFLEFQRIEQSLGSLFTASKSAVSRPHRPIVGEIVAVAYVSWNKFIRAHVEQIAKYTSGKEEYIVWALDYGFPFQTKECNIRKLPSSYAQPTEHIRMGALVDIVPAETDFDFVTMTSKMVCTESWPQRSVAMLEKVISDAASVSFVEKYTRNTSRGLQHFGDLKIINHTGTQILASDFLIRLNFAVRCENDFEQKLSTLRTVNLPRWKTNDGQVNMMENKLNSLNLHYAHQGKFDLSGARDGDACNNLSKQKVMDWCERNMNFSEKHDTGEISSCMSLALDATDISFDDSVSVKGYNTKEESHEDTVMGHAGALHESRRKKYAGKVLPPKPNLDVFQVIPEKKSLPEESVDGSNAGSRHEQRIKKLLQLRRKMEQISHAQQEVTTLHEQIDNLEISEDGTDEFLESCKKKNEALEEPIKEPSEACENTENTAASLNEAPVRSNCGSSTYAYLKELRAKRVAKMTTQSTTVDNTDAQSDKSASEKSVETQSQVGSRTSSYEAELLRKRNKLRQKYLQKSENIVEDQSMSLDQSVIPEVPQQKPKAGYKMPQQTPKFQRLNLPNVEENYNVNPSLPKVEEPSILAEEIQNGVSEPKPKDSDIRKLLNENPFQNMTMVPAGFDVTTLVTRRDRDKHWHTKKTTLNDSFQSNYSDKSRHSGSSHNSSNQQNSVARRTENIDWQNFRLTRSRKERKKSDEKNLLDMTLNDFGCAPAIMPIPVAPSVPKETEDLLIFNDGEKENIAPPNTDEKLIDLSANTEVLDASNVSVAASSDSFVKFVAENNTVKDTSKEKLLETSCSPTSEGSLSLLPPKTNEEKKDYSSSISSSSFTKLEANTAIANKCSETQIKIEKDPDYSYEACSSSSSSISLAKMGHAAQLPKKSTVECLSASSSASPLCQLQSKLVLSSSTSSLISEQPSIEETQCLFRKRIETSKESQSLLGPIDQSSSSTSPTIKRLPRLPQTPSLKLQSNLPEVDGEAVLKTNFIEHLVMAHSRVKIKPLERMTSAMFSAEIHQEMQNMRLTKMYRIQSYAWPHLLRRNSFFVINTSRTGKTWCYLPPLCDMVSYRLETNDLPETYGPVAIVVAPSSIEVEAIARQCRRLLASSKTRVTVVPSYAFRNAEEVKIELHNGCGILIITPPSLQRLLVNNEKESLLNMERVQCLVVDDLDTIISHDSNFDEVLQKLIKPVLQHQENGKVPFQTVFTSKHWTKRMVNLLRISNQPLLCIADFLEAAVYANAKLTIKLQSSSEKLATMVRFLEKRPYSLERVLIVCNTADEVDDVEKSLIDVGISCFSYTDRMSVECSAAVNEWKIKKVCQQIFITTDNVLPELVVQNIWTLIHYSLPLSWTKFNFRFSAFLENYENRLESNFEKPSKIPASLILLDEANNVQLPRLIEFMKHHNQLKYIHPDILKVSDRITADREEARVAKGILMCPNILEFGSCGNGNRCSHRHQLTKFDKPVEGIPTNGEIRLKILNVLSPTHYTARLLTHKNGTTWDIVRRSNEVTLFLMQLTFHMRKEEAQVIHWPLRANDLCIYKAEGVFHRCRVLEVPPILYENIVKLVTVKVKLIDTGSSLTCKSHDILHMPEKFKEFPAQAVDIRLSGVVPFDKERCWDSRSTKTVKKWIMTDVTGKDCLQASINFALMDTIWVSNIVLMEKLETIRGFALKVNVRRSLLGKDFALADDQVHSLKEIAVENGLWRPNPEVSQRKDSEKSSDGDGNLLEFSSSSISVPEEIPAPVQIVEKKSLVTKASETINEEWSRMVIDELMQVKIEELHDPGEFYVRLLNKEEDFRDLEDKIENFKSVPLDDPRPMANCLAPRDGRLHRAKIDRLVVDSVTGIVEVRVFFCDLGVFQSFPLKKLRSSSKSIVEFMPFQAIGCTMTGILPECIGEDVQSVIKNDDSVHFAYAVKEVSNAENQSDGFFVRHYEVILYECFTDKKDIQINKQLVERGLASYNEDTKHFLELETQVDFSNFDYDQNDSGNSYDFQAFLDRVKQQMDEDDAYELEQANKSCEAIEATKNATTEAKIVEITDDRPLESVEFTSSTNTPAMPALKYANKRPPTTWYQTMSFIFLVIHAPDIEDYNLEVEDKRVIFLTTVNGETRALFLNLLGYVEPAHVTHEIRGLNVVVRLLKSVLMEWPRLLEDPSNVSWLKYDFNSIDALEVERLIDSKGSRPRRRMASFSSDSSGLSDSNPCENFTPIVNVDALHDPMEEIF